MTHAVHPETRDAWRRVPLVPRVLLDPASGRAGRGIRALTGSSDWRRRAADLVGCGAVAAVGARALPAGDEPDWPPVPVADLAAALIAAVPGIRPLGVVVPRQAGRPRLSLLARMTGNEVVVKLGRPGEGIEIEATALELLARLPLPGIETPLPLAVGELDLDDVDITYVVTTAIALHRQRPAFDVPLRTFESDLGVRLAELPRPDGAAADLVPVHGDLAPFNLRRTPTGTRSAAAPPGRGSSARRMPRSDSKVRSGTSNAGR